MPPAASSIPELLRAAIQHHQAGRLAQAEHFYRQILAIHPIHADALHNLGALALQVSRHDVAVDLFRQALKHKPRYPQAWSNLAAALQGLKLWQESLDAAQRALDLQPDYAAAHLHRGIALRALHQPEQAVAAYQQALALQPSLASAHFNLANAWEDLQQLDDAIAAYRQAIALQPRFAAAYANLGALLLQRQRPSEALEPLRQALALQPRDALAHSNLGHALWLLGQFEDSLAACDKAVTLAPDLHLAHNNRGNALLSLNRLEQAAAAYQKVIELQPNFALAHSNLGNVCKELRQLDQAAAACQRALELDPRLPQAHYNLANTLKYLGRHEEALAAYRQAIALAPDFQEAWSNLLFYINFHPGFDAPAIGREHQQWHERFAQPLHASITLHSNDRNPERKLKVGYVSPDFYQQAETFFTLPLLSHHHHDAFEIHCYSSVRQPDALTDRLRATADHWHEVRHLSDEALAQRIREDQIDILIDLTMHMAHGRPLLFARKPAPVQLCWLAYPGTTGLPTIDYRLTDPFLDPPQSDTSCYAEKSLPLPGHWIVYDPLAQVPARPVRHAGSAITFGSLNNPAKVNDPLLHLWARTLQAIPQSRLLLLIPSDSFRRHILSLFATHQVDPERLAFVSHMDRTAYLRAYDSIDIALDPLPYHGITTTCDALYMGVPVLTLTGPTAPGRASQSILSALALHDWITHTPEDFIQAAVRHAGDLPALDHLHATLRPRLEQSPLMNGPRFAQQMETLYRQAWTNWCQSPKPLAD